jgi:hypothetical protein
MIFVEEDAKDVEDVNVEVDVEATCSLLELVI